MDFKGKLLCKKDFYKKDVYDFIKVFTCNKWYEVIGSGKGYFILISNYEEPYHFDNGGNKVTVSFSFLEIEFDTVKITSTNYLDYFEHYSYERDYKLNKILNENIF